MRAIRELYEDAKNIEKKDPAAKNIWYVILLYQGFHILVFHRIGHFLYRHKLFFLARLVSQIARFFTGIEIHPRSYYWKEIIYRSWNGYSNRRNSYHRK